MKRLKKGLQGELRDIERINFAMRLKWDQSF